jgi:hypothetical protein
VLLWRPHGQDHRQAASAEQPAEVAAEKYKAMKAEQAVLDFSDVADMVIVLAIDGREVELPRRDVIAVPGSKHRYLRPESLLEVAPQCTALPPPHRPPDRTGKRP